MRCAICGADLPVGAMFCGECGSSTSATPASRRMAETVAIEPLEPLEPLESQSLAAPAETIDRVIALDRPAPSASATSIEPATPIEPVARRDQSSTPAVEAVLPPPHSPQPASARFTFECSTGETIAITGATGLLGRRPRPEPSEVFDQLIHVDDRGLSVSKTHLEFGQLDGTLWVSDRYSGNGTVIRGRDGSAIRCEPGRRYMVDVGSRIDIGEQHITVR